MVWEYFMVNVTVGHQSLISSSKPFISRNSEPVDFWEQLTFSQQCSARSLSQFGYALMFVRFRECGSLAVLSKEGQLATISASGLINVEPQITLRNSSNEL